MAVTPELRHAFNFHRRFVQVARNVRHGNAMDALRMARADLAAGRKHYTSSPWRKPVGNGARFATHERDKPALQWIEKPADMGLRFVGYCDQIRDTIRHTGWYSDAYQDSSLRGVVYQLPGRDGKARFVVGHDNSDNGAADNGGPACVDWSQIFVSDFEAELRDARRQIGKAYWTPAMDRPGYWAEAAHESARKEAASAADEFARIEAERASEYDRAWQAGSAYASTLEERASLKTELRALLGERRQAMRELAAQGIGVGVKGGALCAAIERRARDMLESLAELSEKARNLAAGDGGECLSFWPGNATLKAAFNEGAGQTVLD